MEREISCEYIEANLDNASLGLQSVCGQVGLSAPYFSHLFKEEMEIGLNSYIRQRRIGRACELLTTTDLKNELIAQQLGFSSENYFHSVFKKETGLTPGEYRKKHRQ